MLNPISLFIFRVDILPHFEYACRRPGGSGAAEPCEPRQVREEAAVSRCLRVPPGLLPGHFSQWFGNIAKKKAAWVLRTHAAFFSSPFSSLKNLSFFPR